MSVFLSIVIPVYNSQKYLRLCLNSICTQIKTNIEVILVDDASKDNSKKICNLFVKKFNFVKLLSNKKNQGVSLSRNLGINFSKGKYLLFLDSDDELSKNSVNYILQQIKKKPFCDFFFLRSQEIYQKKIDLNQVLKFKLKKNKSIFYMIKDYNKFRATCWNFLIKKEFVQKNRIKFDNILVFEDQVFVTKILYSANYFDVLEKPIYQRRLFEPYSLSSTIGYTVVISCLKIILSILKLVPVNQKLNSKIKLFLISRINYAFKQLLLNIVNCSYKDIINSQHYISKIKKDFIKITKSKNSSIVKNSFYNIEKLISKNFLNSYKEKKIDLLKKFTKDFRNKKVIVFCAGSYARLAINLIKKMKIDISFIIDNNKNFLNKKLDGITIKNSCYFKESIKKFKSKNILICNQNYNEFNKIKFNLISLGIKRDSIYHVNI